MPFPAVTFCPELNKTLIQQQVDCRLLGYCDGLTNSQISTNINAVSAACSTCAQMKQELEQIEEDYQWELVLEDSANNTYIEYLKNFLDASLISQQSFCLSGRKDLQLQEGVATGSGFCYTVNGQERMFNEKT